jgi:hypothetical protein
MCRGRIWTREFWGRRGVSIVMACAVVALVGPLAQAQAFTASELEAITRHLARGAGNSNSYTCQSTCQDLWTAEQSSQDALLQRELLTLRQRTTLLPTFWNTGWVPLNSTLATTRVSGLPGKVITIEPPTPSAHTPACPTSCVQQMHGIRSGEALSPASGILAPSNGFQWYWGGKYRRLVPDPNSTSCNDHPTVPAGFQIFERSQNTWCIVGRHEQVGFLDGEDIPIPAPIQDYTGQSTTTLSGSGSTPSEATLKTAIQNQFAGGDFDYLVRWYELQLNGGCEPGASVCERTMAETFRPLLLFDSDEKWRPLDVDRFLTESFNAETLSGDPLVVRHLLCGASESPEDGDCRAIFGPQSLNGAGSDSHIDVVGADSAYTSSGLFAVLPYGDYYMPGCGGQSVLDCDDSRTAIYYRVQPSTGYTLLDYWWFYRRDSGYAGIGDHEGDWEGAIVALPKDPLAMPDTFDWVGMDSHGTTYLYLRPVLACDGGDAGSCGTQLDPTGLRVNTYVSNGKHASYPQPCDNDGPTICENNDGIPDGGFDGSSPWASNNRATALVHLPPEHQSWMGFEGEWGGVPGPPALDSENTRGDPSDWTCSERWASPEDGSCDEWGGQALMAGGPDQTQSATCNRWLGPQVAIGACNAKLLSRSLRQGNLLDTATFETGDPGGGHTTASGSGITQTVGPPLHSGDDLALASDGHDANVVLVRFINEGRVFQARFKDVPLGKATISVVRDLAGAVVPVLKGAGPTIRPDSIQLSKP